MFNLASALADLLHLELLQMSCFCKAQVGINDHMQMWTEPSTKSQDTYQWPQLERGRLSLSWNWLLRVYLRTRKCLKIIYPIYTVVLVGWFQCESCTDSNCYCEFIIVISLNVQKTECHTTLEAFFTSMISETFRNMNKIGVINALIMSIRFLLQTPLSLFVVE